MINCGVMDKALVAGVQEAGGNVFISIARHQSTGALYHWSVSTLRNKRSNVLQKSYIS